MRNRRSHVARGWWAIVLAGLIPAEVAAQPPQTPTPTGPPAVCQRRGRLHRFFHHTAHTLEDQFIGYPDAFVEPPLGYYVNTQLALQVAKADPHRFTLYRSDFLPGTNRFSPIGASRFNLMVPRLAGSAGPIIVEWTPDQPTLGQARRQAVLATLERVGWPIPDERVVIGPSPYPGAMGVEAASNFGNTVARSQAAAQNLPLSPTESASLGVR
jgi:hypothetical protein